jgi:hypothetical protein
MLHILRNAYDNAYLNKYTDSLEFATKRFESLRFLIEIIHTNLRSFYEAESVETTINHTMRTMLSEESESSMSIDVDDNDIETEE